MFGEASVIAMLLLAIAGAVACLALPRPRQVLATTLGVTAVETALAANLWAAIFAGPGFISTAEQWFYIDAFSAFHIVVLVLVFLLSSAFAGIYFTSETDEGAFTPAIARRFGALWLASLAAMILVLVSNNLGIMWVGM